MSQHALARCYDAMADAALWPEAMEALAAAMNARAACFHPKGAGAERLQMPASADYRDLLSDMFNGGWRSQDLRASRGWPLVLAGQQLVLEGDVTTEDERRRSPIYRELFDQHDAGQFAGLGCQVDGRYWAVNAIRSERDGGFETEAARLTALRPQLERFLRFASAFSQMAARGALQTLSMAETAAILLDAHGRVIEINPSALSLMPGVLDVGSGMLVARDPSARSQLDAMIARALAPGEATHQAGGRVSVLRPDGVAVLVEAFPLRNVLADAFALSGVMVLLKPAPRPDTVSLLRATYRLTPREAQAAKRLATGQSVDDIASALDLKPTSVRQLIKQVLAKTGTRRQAELVALLSRPPRQEV